jgi:hypothetical protein
LKQSKVWLPYGFDGPAIQQRPCPPAIPHNRLFRAVARRNPVNAVFQRILRGCDHGGIPADNRAGRVYRIPLGKRDTRSAAQFTDHPESLVINDRGEKRAVREYQYACLSDGKLPTMLVELYLVPVMAL